MDRPQKLKVSEVYTSSSESENENILEHHSSSRRKIKINDYVVAKVFSKKSEKYYIALVLSRKEKDVQLKFLKKCGTKFVYPEKDDIAYADISDIVTVLYQPTVNNRQQYSFESSGELFDLNILH